VCKSRANLLIITCAIVAVCCGSATYAWRPTSKQIAVSASVVGVVGLAYFADSHDIFSPVMNVLKGHKKTVTALVACGVVALAYSIGDKVTMPDDKDRSRWFIRSGCYEFLRKTFDGFFKMGGFVRDCNDIHIATTTAARFVMQTNKH